MSSACIFIEGGGNSEELKRRCREGFHKLLDKSGFTRRAPRLVACGSRNDAYDAFQTAHRQGKFTYVALWVDSEAPVVDGEQTWQHLKLRDQWERPAGAVDEQVFLMTTCMETWIVAGRVALNQHYKGGCLQETTLPSLVDLEQKNRHLVQDSLVHATRTCTNAYTKNKRSFEALGSADPVVLKAQLSAFARMVRILNERLKE